jgi:hypothetical protein
MFSSVDGGRSRTSSSGTTSRGEPTVDVFTTLMVGAPRPPAPAPPPRGLSLTFSSVDGGRSRISSSGTAQGARRRHFYSVHGERS